MRGRTRGTPGQDRSSRHDWWGVVVDSPDPHALATFYATLTGWSVVGAPGDDDVGLDAGEGVAYLSFQRATAYVRPTWPVEPGAQQMVMHVDLEVDDLDAAVGHAVELGAEVAAYQPQDDVRVLLDPDGHPFCLYASTDPAGPTE
jgi:hypothetical protein